MTQTLKQIYSYTEARNASDDDTERLLYYYHPTIMKLHKKIFKICIDNEEIEMDPVLMDEINKRIWTLDDKYTLVLAIGTNISVYYK